MAAPGLGMIAALMGGGGLPSIPCPLCTVELERDDVARRELITSNVTTMVLGTPCCAMHAGRLVHALAKLTTS